MRMIGFRSWVEYKHSATWDPFPIRLAVRLAVLHPFEYFC